jgi:hypothetical protein
MHGQQNDKKYMDIFDKFLLPILEQVSLNHILLQLDGTPQEFRNKFWAYSLLESFHGNRLP